MLFISSKRVGPRKLFTKEERFLLNRRVPDLASATSVSATQNVFTSSLTVRVIATLSLNTF